MCCFLNQELIIMIKLKKSLKIVGPNHGEVTINRKTFTIPSPSEISLHWLFLACFQLVWVIFHLNHPISCTSMNECANHILWYYNGRFVNHPYCLEYDHEGENFRTDHIFCIAAAGR